MSSSMKKLIFSFAVSHVPSNEKFYRTASFRRFRDTYFSLSDLQTDLRRAGLESSNLVLAVDFTASNKWQGKATFGGKPLHTVAPGVLNPYETALTVIAQTLAPFDDDGLIPTYGFGSQETKDDALFSFLPRDEPLVGLDAVLRRYREIVPGVVLAGPTSFAPAIRRAIELVVASGGAYHILIIVADGQVTRSVDAPRGELSQQEEETVNAIVEASRFPLSIVIVGVGDGPWDKMNEFDDELPARAFDNLQFVALNDVITKATRRAGAGASPHDLAATVEAAFALAALMECPEQYREMQRLRLLGAGVRNQPRSRRPVTVLPPPPPPPPPPPAAPGAWAAPPNTGVPPAWQGGAPPHGYAAPPGGGVLPAPFAPGYGATPPQWASAPPAAAPAPAAAAAAAAAASPGCPVCFEPTRDMVFNCGHMTCQACAPQLQTCPICRQRVTTRTRVFL